MDADMAACELIEHLARQCEAAMRVEFHALQDGDLLTAAIGAEAAESASALAFEISGAVYG